MDPERVPTTSIARLEALFIAGELREALELSERLRRDGYFSAKVAVIQAACLDQLGCRSAANARLVELERAMTPAAAAPVLAVARQWVGSGKYAERTRTAMHADATRFIPKLAGRPR
jgi:hypothetical protein